VAVGVTNQNIYGLCPQEHRPQQAESCTEDNCPEGKMDLRILLERRRAER
jgi:hypothetical protein